MFFLSNVWSFGLFGFLRFAMKIRVKMCHKKNPKTQNFKIYHINVSSEEVVYVYFVLLDVVKTASKCPFVLLHFCPTCFF